MKKRTKLIIGLACALGATLALAGCTIAEAPYDSLAKEGANVQIVYDRNGGVFAALDNFDLVDVYKGEDVERGVRLLAPGDSRRGTMEAQRTSISRSGYFFAGWYRVRTPLTDGAGNALDEDGAPCSQTGKAQAYTYGGRWDFDAERCGMDDVTPIEGEKDRYSLTLYAAWIPNFTYSFYCETEDGWQEYATVEINPSVTESIDVPVWDDNSGRLNYSLFPTREGYTFEKVFADPQKATELTSAIPHTGEVDYATGTGVGRDVPLYTTWRAGNWYKVSKAQQLINNASSTGSYELLGDLDFEGLSWPFSGMQFGGTIEGNGHVVQNVTARQTSSDQRQYGGLFGRILAGAKLTDVSFENVSFTLSAGTNRTEGSYGLFAGEFSEQATVEGVTVTGNFYVGNVFENYRGADSAYIDGYSVGVISGNLWDGGISAEEISVEAIEVDYKYDIYGNAVKGYTRAVSVEADGSVRISAIDPEA